MLTSSSTDVYSGIGQVASETLGGFWVYIIAIVGIIVAFFVIETILKSLYPDKYRNEIEYIEK